LAAEDALSSGQIRAFSGGLPDSRRPKGSAVAGSSDLGPAAVGERQWSWLEPGLLRCFAALIRRDRMLVSLGRTAVEFLAVLAGQALMGSLTGQAGQYSKKVLQPVRT
jgi:hypothetical protein